MQLLFLSLSFTYIISAFVLLTNFFKCPSINAFTFNVSFSESNFATSILSSNVIATSRLIHRELKKIKI